MAIVNKTIKVNLYNISKEELETLYATYQPTIGIDVTSMYGAQAIIINGNIIVDSNLAGIEEISLLTNDIDLEFPLVKTNTVALVFGDGITVPEEFGIMPSFGITIDDNINVQQFNITIADADKLFKDRISSIWDIDGNLRSNRNTFTAAQIIEYGNYVLEKGYYAPIVCYIDSVVQIIDYPYTHYLSNILGLVNVPIRAITYKDIKYLSDVCPEFYTAIKTISPNNYYSQLDDENCLDHAIIDYGDKRKILQRYEKRKYTPITPMIDNTNLFYKETDWATYLPIYYFIFDETHSDRNDKLINDIIIGNYYGRTQREDGKLGNTSFGGELQSYLRCYDKFIVEPDDSTQIENYDYNITELSEQYEEYVDTKGLNAISASLFIFTYRSDKMDLHSRIAETIGADAFIYANKPSLINITNIHTFLQKGTINIKYVKPKL